MTDLKTSATMNESEVNKVYQILRIRSRYSTTNANISPANTTETPTMEGRASTLKKSKESQNKYISKQLGKQTT